MTLSAWIFAALTLLAYLGGIKLVKVMGWHSLPALIPALAALMLTVGLLPVTYEQYMEGGQLIAVWLAPATVALGLALYRQRQVLIRHLRPVLLASGAGTVTALFSTVALCHLFNIDLDFSAPLLLKSVTTPVALSIAETIGAVPALAVIMVVMAGTLGGAGGLSLLTILRVKSPVARGLAMGTASHVLGTATVLKESETSAAVGSVALILAGIFTALLAPWLVQLL